MLMKNKKILFVYVIILLLILTACNNKTKESDILQFGVLRVEDAIPVFAAENFDSFKDDVEIIIFSNTREMDLALESGIIDGILSDLVRSILLKSGDEDIRITASASPVPSSKRKFALVVSPGSQINNLEDMLNKEIGISENSIIAFLTDKFLEKSNLSREDVRMKSVPDIKLRFEALLSSSLETGVLPEPLVTSGENEGVRVLISDTDLAEDYSQTVYIFRKEYLDSNGDKVKRFLETIAAAGKIINENPNKYLPLVAEKAGISEKLLENYYFSAIEEIKIPDKKIINEINQWMLSKNIAKKEFLYEELVYPDFAGGY